MNSKKVICVFSGTRAEYGLLHPLIHKINIDDSLKLCLIVSGSHLSSDFGLTYQEIEEDGFRIDEKVEILVNSDSPSGVCKSMGLGLIQYIDALKRLNPDIVLILGDRYEVFAFAVTALVNNIPIAHLYGGELSFGAIDESFRHAITKMSHLHFTSTDSYRDRVIQLGEHPNRVFNVGALGVENINSLKLLTREEFGELTGYSFDEPYFLITYHPETIEGVSPEKNFRNVLDALSQKELSGYKFIFTKANADSHGRQINRMIERFANKVRDRAVVFASMGQKNYLSAMKYAKAVIGNSSSGIIEAPCFNVPVINIGIRQKGRLRANNIIDCNPVKSEIVAAIQKGLSVKFKMSVKNMHNPFQKDRSSTRILSVLKDIDIAGLCGKNFYDLPMLGREKS